MRSNDLLLPFSEPSTSTLSSAWVQKQSTEPAVFPVSGQKAKHHRPRQLERGACLLYHGPRALLALGQCGQNPFPTLG